jgi:glutamate-1-semialdehyde 2,1-aminomutase
MPEDVPIAGGANDPIPIPDTYPDWVHAGDGPYVYDEDGNEYVDLWMGFGGLLLGHADPQLSDVIADRADDGWFFSYPTTLERDVARTLCDTIPSAESVRFATSGSDAVAYALRAARAYTGHDDVLTIAGGYHGVHEGLMGTDGFAADPDDHLEFVPFNDLQRVREELASEEYAALLLEPVLANAGCVPPESDFLATVRDLCTDTDTLLIFDEVVTGFRLAPGGAQARFGVEPDVSTFSKAIANGLPLSAVCGRADVLSAFEPAGDVMFAGTFNGHPISLAGASHTIDRITEDGFQQTIDELGERFRSSAAAELATLDDQTAVQGIGSMATVAFGVDSFPHGLAVDAPDKERYREFVAAAATNGMLLPPLATETMFFAPVHEPIMDDVEAALADTVDDLRE